MHDMREQLDLKALSLELAELYKMRDPSIAQRRNELLNILSNAPETLGEDLKPKDSLLGRVDYMGASC